MNDPITESISKSSSEHKSDEKDAGSVQLMLSRKLTQKIKDQLKELKRDTTAHYSMGMFLSIVVENNWMSELEHLRKTFEKLKRNRI